MCALPLDAVLSDLRQRPHLSVGSTQLSPGRHVHLGHVGGSRSMAPDSYSPWGLALIGGGNTRREAPGSVPSTGKVGCGGLRRTVQRLRSDRGSHSST